MKETIQRYRAIFHYKGRKIPFQYWTHTSQQTPIDTIIFLGSGQIGNIPKWVAAAAPSGVVVADGLPHWEAEPSAKDIKEFAEEYTQVVFNIILENFKLKHVHVIAISQAAPGVITLATKAFSKVKSIGLVTPLGFTRNAFGESEEARIKELKRRVFRTALQPRQSPLYSPRNLYVFFVLMRARLSEIEQGASDRKYAAGLSHSLLEESRHLLEQQRTKKARLIVFLGENDIIFPVSEVNTALKVSGLSDIEVVVLPEMSHTSFVGRRDKTSLNRIVTTIRS